MRRIFSLFSLSGRITRRDYWFRVIFMFLLSPVIIITILPPDILVGLDWPTVTANPLFCVFVVILNWLVISAGVQRFHDRGRSGWLLLASLVPLIGQLWVFVELAFLKGTSGPNKFGPEPMRR